jgi:hypothetical protein
LWRCAARQLVAGRGASCQGLKESVRYYLRQLSRCFWSRGQGEPTLGVTAPSSHPCASAGRSINGSCVTWAATFCLLLSTHTNPPPPTRLRLRFVWLRAAPQANPGVAVVERLEDLWVLSKLQLERKAAAAAAGGRFWGPGRGRAPCVPGEGRPAGMPAPRQGAANRPSLRLCPLPPLPGALISPATRTAIAAEGVGSGLGPARAPAGPAASEAVLAPLLAPPAAVAADPDSLP